MQAFSEVTLCSRALINPNLNSKFPEEVKKIEAPELEGLKDSSKVFCEVVARK